MWARRLHPGSAVPPPSPRPRARSVREHARWMVMAGPAALMEVAQAVTAVGVADVADLLANTVGATVRSPRARSCCYSTGTLTIGGRRWGSCWCSRRPHSGGGAVGRPATARPTGPGPCPSGSPAPTSTSTGSGNASVEDDQYVATCLDTETRTERPPPLGTHRPKPSSAQVPPPIVNTQRSDTAAYARYAAKWVRVAPGTTGDSVLAGALAGDGLRMARRLAGSGARRLAASPISPASSLPKALLATRLGYARRAT